MKKLFFAAALFFASFAADAQITYELADSIPQYNQSFPKLNATRDSLTFTITQIVVRIAEAPVGKHEQVYQNIPVILPLASFNPLTFDSIIRQKAIDFVNETYNQ